MIYNGMEIDESVLVFEGVPDTFIIEDEVFAPWKIAYIVIMAFVLAVISKSLYQTFRPSVVTDV